MKKRRVISVVIMAIIVLPIALQLSIIAQRLARNQPVARSLADSLTTRFWAAKFVGSASYERDYIYITAYGVADKSAQAGIRDWLMDEKARRHLDERILLRFTDEKTGNDLGEYEI
jgi:hypothetical protein